jgi:DNA-binding CsgD family transcriptional regulator
MTGLLTKNNLLVATLGSEPQVVTAALDLLSRQGYPIARGWVLHTVSPVAEMQAALERLTRQVMEGDDAEQPGLEFIPIGDAQSRPLEDVETPAQTTAAFTFLYRTIRIAKEEGWRVHLLIAGGRKTLALFGMAAAQLLFDEDDRLWHLYSAGDFLASKRLHPEPGDLAHLIPIPVIRWSQVSPLLSGLSQVDDPFEAIARVERLQLAERMEQARSFTRGALTFAEEKVVALLVGEGLSDAEIAGRLGLSPRTVGDHLSSAYQKAANHWELADVGRTQLVQLLYLYYIH